MKSIILKVSFYISLYFFISCFNTVSAVTELNRTELNKFDYGLYILIDTREQSGKWIACFLSPNGKKVIGKVGDSVGIFPNDVTIASIDRFQIIVQQLFLLNREQWTQRVFAWHIYEKYKENCWK